MSTDATTATKVAEELSSQILANSLTVMVLKAYLDKAGVMPLKKVHQKNLALLKKWIEEPHQRQPYFFLMKPQIIVVCLNNFGGSQWGYNKIGKEELIQMLAAHSNSGFSQATPSRAGTNASTLKITLVHTLLLKPIFESPFMPKLNAKGKEYCKMGQELEIPFITKLLKHSRQGITRFHVKKILFWGGKRYMYICALYSYICRKVNDYYIIYNFKKISPQYFM